VIFTVNNAFVYSGPVQFEYFTQQLKKAGSVSPSSRTLAPGQSATFQVDLDGVNSVGDHVATLQLNTGGPNDGGIPVVVRSLVPIRNDRGSFNGVLTGGAATGNAGQRLTYQFDVPKGEDSLNLGIHFQDPDLNVIGFLTDPNGEPLDTQATTTLDASGSAVVLDTLQFFRRTPEQGRWTISLSIRGPLDGTHLSSTFTGKIDFDAPNVTPRDVPDSRRTQLAAGVPVTATIRVKNTGNSIKDFFADPRLRDKQLLGLAGGDTTNVALPLSLAAQPFWIVPPGSDTFLVLAQGSAPIVMDVSSAFGDPDRLAADIGGNTVLATVHAPEVAPTQWFGLPELKGPFPPNGSHGTVNLIGAVITNPFDSAITSSTGDAWLQTVDPSAPFSPLTLAPGQTGTITLTIKPNAPRGTVVRGFIGIDTINVFTVSGDELIQIPYEYTVK
jgi:hypothetical protein